jgi:integrin beta 3
LIDNYCRNPDGEATIWCYTVDSKKRWEYCEPIPGPPEFGPEACSGNKCSGYRGKQTKTRSGKTCQAWKEDKPHKRNGREALLKKFPSFVENFCRNSNAEESTIWCYTTDEKKRWEFCDPVTEEAKPEFGAEECSGKKCMGYRGKQNITRGGNTCQDWDTDKPHKRNGRQDTLKKHPELIDNYCRSISP